ncbi:MAG: DUF5615 family PIN-like protein [Flavisolibacter sp.]|nr:DUF5615 family PIN-like protein [Flavisolibacter sp.]
MKLLANENFPLLSVFFLRNAGHDVTYIADGFKSISDVSVIQLAIQEQRIIITFDRDYGELIFKHNYKPPQGVIYLRLIEFQPDEPGIMVHNLLSSAFSTENMLTVFDGENIRQRKY